MKKIKTLYCLAITFLLLFNYSNVYAFNSNEYIETTQISIEKILDLRTKALLEDNTTDYNIYNKQLSKLGFVETNISEINKITDNTIFDENSSFLKSQLSAPNIKFERKNYTYSYNGKSYDILQIVATPEAKSSLLYQSGAKILTKSNAAQISSTAALQFAMDTVVGFTKVPAILYNLFNLVRGTLPNISSSTTVSDVSANYTWNAAQTCAFFFVFDNNLGSYRQAGRFHKITSAVAVNIPTLIVSGKDVVADIIQSKKSVQYTPPKYGHISSVLNAYISKTIFTQSVNSILIKGLNNLQVAHVSFRSPKTPIEAGY